MYHPKTHPTLATIHHLCACKLLISVVLVARRFIKHNFSLLVMDESDVWRRSHGRHSSVKNRWPHAADESKTGEFQTENESWLQSLGRRSSVKNRWPHEADGPSDSSKPSAGSFRRENSADLQDGSRQEQSYHHAKSKTGEVPGRNVKMIPSTTRSKTTSHTQDISQSPPVVTPTPAPRVQPKPALKHKAGHTEVSTSGWSNSLSAFCLVEYSIEYT